MSISKVVIRKGAIIMSNVTNNINVNNNPAVNYNTNKNTTQTNTAATVQETTTANTDVDTSAVTVKSNTSKYQPDVEKVNSLYAEQKNYLQGLQNIVNQFKYQSSGVALLNSISQNQNQNSKPDNLYNLSGMSKMDGLSGMQDYFSLFTRNSDGTFSVDLSGMSPEAADKLISKAKEDVSEDGFFGVKQTSERILSFAKAITGGDPDKMEKMKKVVDKAFAQVGSIFGGLDKMPEISRKTYDAVMKGFDELSKAAKAE